MTAKTTQSSYAADQANLDRLCNEVIVIRRLDKANVAVISANELSSWIETLHLLKSTKNAVRLLIALLRTISGA
jgi:antitoxin YefM